MKFEFEWSEEKSQRNVEKHGVRFEDAQTIFDGPVLTVTDDRFDYGELRETSLGLFNGVVVLTVVHTDRGGRVRLISARKASTKERRRYEKAIQQGADG